MVSAAAFEPKNFSIEAKISPEAAPPWTPVARSMAIPAALFW
jgi:hypothetical protein